MTIEQFSAFLTSHELSDFLLPLKVIAILVSLIMVCLIAYYIIKQRILLNQTKSKFKHFFSKQEFTVQANLANQWKDIKALLPKEDQVSYRLIVAKSANLFFDMLERSNLNEKTLDELNEVQVPNIEDIREIVNLSIKLKNEPTTFVDIQRTKELVSAFERTIQRLHLF